MMYGALSVFVFVTLSSIVQGLIVAVYVRKLFSTRPRLRRTTNLPKAAVVFSVRGPDPFLETNLSALLQQDYPDFTVFVIVDSSEDTALPVIQRVYESAPDLVDVQILEHPPLGTCSLKCSSLAQVVEGLDPSYKVVAFMDGDARPHEDWLRDSGCPFAGPFGGRGDRKSLLSAAGWRLGLFGPLLLERGGHRSSLVRTGSSGPEDMALRREVIDEVGIVAAWRKALSVDATVVRQLKTRGYRAQFVPSVMMANYEEITVDSYIPWSERQMIAAKSCGSNFTFVNLHAINILCCLTLPVAMAMAGWVSGNAQVTWISLAGMSAFWLSAGLSVFAIELGVRHVLALNHVEAKWLNTRTIVRLLPALVMTYFVYLRILVGAYARNRVSWRGVEYQIHGVNDIQMVAYHPFKGSQRTELVRSVV